MQTAKRSGDFSRSFMHRYSTSHHAAMTSQVLTNLVFLVRRKDQPLDKSVFIRKEEKPSSIYQPCLGHYSLSFSLKPAFLSTNIRHLSWLVSLIVPVEDQSSKTSRQFAIRMINQTSESLVFRFAHGMPRAVRYIELTLWQDYTVARNL